MVSIVVPVYNVEKYLRKCLDSLINQTYKDIEIIIVDDGSTDNSGKICDEYEKKNKNIKVIHKENQGLGFARNTGIENINGEYVTFVDSDDYVDNDYIEELYKNIINRNADVCKSGFRRVDDECNVLEIRKYDNCIFDKKEIRNTYIPRMIGSLPDKKDSIEMCVTGVLYKTSYILKYKINFPSERVIISEDLFFNIDYAQNISKVIIIEYVGYNYRYNPSSLTKKYKKDRFEASKYIYLQLKKKIEEFGYADETFLRLSRMFFIYLKMCIVQEKFQISKKKYRDSIATICEISEDGLVQEIIGNYPIRKLGVKQRIFIYLLKYKLVRIIYILAIMNMIN